MKEKQFSQLSKEYFGRVLEPKGFSVEQSQYSTFYKKRSDDIYYVIMPDLSRDGTWFDIKVFVVSPLIEPQFNEHFPDMLSIPSDSFSSLHPNLGVGARMHKYRCKTEEGFIRNFNKDVVSALEERALEYLDNISRMDDFIPYLKRDFYLGAALWHTNKKEQAENLLESERLRLSNISDDTGRVSALLNYIDNILKKKK